MGLGQGTLFTEAGGLGFASAFASNDEELGVGHPLDAFVDLDGKALVRTSRPWLRPFNREELTRIIGVGLCLVCHPGDGPMMKRWMHGESPGVCKRLGQATHLGQGKWSGRSGAAGP